MRNLYELIKMSQNQKTKKLAVVGSDDEEVLKSVIEADKLKIIEPILIGNIKKTVNIAKKAKLDIGLYEKINVDNLKESAEIAVKLIRTKKADFIMKGLIDTSILLKEVLNKEHGLIEGGLLSHVMLYEVPSYQKLLLITDGGMNINPSVEERISIIKNVVSLLEKINYKEINVACLSAKEKVSSKIQSTIDAREIERLWKIKGDSNVTVEGPMALDLAVSKEAAKTKGFKSNISGRVDVLLVPNIEMGNGIGKSLTYLSNAKSAGIIMGAKVPIVLASRSDNSNTKLNSIALGSIL